MTRGSLKFMKLESDLPDVQHRIWQNIILFTPASKLSQEVTFMAHARKVFVSNICRDNELTRLRFPLFYSVPIGRYLDNSSN